MNKKNLLAFIILEFGNILAFRIINKNEKIQNLRNRYIKIRSNRSKDKDAKYLESYILELNNILNEVNDIKGPIGRKKIDDLVYDIKKTIYDFHQEIPKPKEEKPNKIGFI